MDEIAKRLEWCKQYLEAELRQPNPSKVYIDDLQSSIVFFEKQLQRKSDIIDGAKV